MKHLFPKQSDQSGFTIVELMIATSILATIILLVTIMMLSIGNLFVKGINQARTQDTVRTISDLVAQDLKLNNSYVSDSATLGPYTIKSYCIGTSVRYSVITGFKLGNPSSTDTLGSPIMPHVIWRDDWTNHSDEINNSSDNTATCKPIDLTSLITSDDGKGQELMAPNSRLTAFNITPNSPVTGSSSFDLQVGVAYGDEDLLIPPININSVCVGTAGNQYCSTARLSTTVTRRITSGS
jgi:prepilin-type N-terminal cleavage/methylation domain-containing protein